MLLDEETGITFYGSTSAERWDNTASTVTPADVGENAGR
jgi:hypothetical protein